MPQTDRKVSLELFVSQKKRSKEKKKTWTPNVNYVCDCSLWVCMCGSYMTMWWISLKAKENMTFRNYSTWMYLCSWRSVVRRRDIAKDMMCQIIGEDFSHSLSIYLFFTFALTLTFAFHWYSKQWILLTFTFVMDGNFDADSSDGTEK